MQLTVEKLCRELKESQVYMVPTSIKWEHGERERDRKERERERSVSMFSIKIT